MNWTDVHTHLNMLEVSPEEAIEEAVASGVTGFITIGTCPDDLPTVMALAQKFAPRVSCTLGVHPHEAELFTPEVDRWIRTHAVNPEVVAIGETGLDYYYFNKGSTAGSPSDLARYKERQIEVFRAQMQIAADLGLPVEIHTRDAEPDTMQMLREFKTRVKGLLHCFTGTWEMAKAGLDCGFNISISGVVTFKNADALRDVVTKVPLDRLHVETDAPFLAPVPHRGKKNRPAFVTHTAQKVAELKGVDLKTLAEATQANAHKLFSKLAKT
jgi:TatD DNase family protein